MELIFLIVGIIIGFFLDKVKVKKTEEKLRAMLIKPEGKVIDSKEVNSLNKDSDEVNYQHNDYFDNIGNGNG